MLLNRKKTIDHSFINQEYEVYQDFQKSKLDLPKYITEFAESFTNILISMFYTGLNDDNYQMFLDIETSNSQFINAFGKLTEYRNFEYTYEDEMTQLDLFAKSFALKHHFNFENTTKVKTVTLQTIPYFLINIKKGKNTLDDLNDICTKYTELEEELTSFFPTPFEMKLSDGRPFMTKPDEKYNPFKYGISDILEKYIKVWDICRTAVCKHIGAEAYNNFEISIDSLDIENTEFLLIDNDE